MDRRIAVGVVFALIFGFATTGYAQEICPSISWREYYFPASVRLSDQANSLVGSYLENRGQRTEKPPLSGWRVAGEILGGLVGEVAGFGPILIYGLVEREPEEWGGIAWLELSILIYPFSTAAGVYLVGNIGNQTGSFSAALWNGCIGSLVGILGSAIILGFLEVESEDAIVLGALAFGGFGGPIAATIGFNKTRRYKIPPAESDTALINYRNGQISLAVPSVYFRADTFGRRALSPSIDLLRLKF